MSWSPSTNSTPNPATQANVDAAAYPRPPHPQQRGTKRSAMDASTNSSTSVGAAGKQTPRQEHEQEHEQEQDEDEESDESEESDAGSDVEAEDVDRARREKALVLAFDNEQRERLYAWRRAGLSKAVCKRFASHVLQQSVGDSVGIALMGVSKVFVGELVSRAVHVQTQWGDSGALSPDHLREAWRKYPRRTRRRRLFP